MLKCWQAVSSITGREVNAASICNVYSRHTLRRKKVGALAALLARPNKRVVVVGAGIGGLAAAIRLAAAGFEVEVFEKNGQVGGRMGRLEAGGFSFDTGPSLLLMTDTYRELFAFAGRDLDDYVRLIPLDGDYKVTFGD